MAARIEDYALIGDCEIAALVDRNGSIDWLCWPDFSSDACFAALLGKEENGYWRITPANGKWKTTRRYRPHTLILETTFEHADGSFRLIDFMPIRPRHCRAQPCRSPGLCCNARRKPEDGCRFHGKAWRPCKFLPGLWILL